MHQVRYFLAVAQSLNFTRAADQCHVAQPSLTRAIQKLEEELGGLLFHRERQNTHLTELGRLMHPHLERTYHAAEAARSLARSIKSGDTSPLRIGKSSAISTTSMIDLFDSVRACVKGVELTLRQASEKELCEQALAGEYDIVLLSDVHDLPERMRSWILFREKLRVIMPAHHELARHDEIDIMMLDAFDLIDNAGTSDRELLLAACGGMNIAPRFRHQVHSTDELQAMVGSNFGLGLLPANVPLAPGLVARPLVGAKIELNMVVAITAGRPFNQATEACLRLARNKHWPQTNEPVLLS